MVYQTEFRERKVIAQSSVLGSLIRETSVQFPVAVVLRRACNGASNPECSCATSVLGRVASTNGSKSITHKSKLTCLLDLCYSDDVSCLHSSDPDAMHQMIQSHHKHPSFSTVRELIRYYRSGDCKNFRLTTQLSPIPRGLSAP